MVLCYDEVEGEDFPGVLAEWIGLIGKRVSYRDVSISKGEESSRCDFAPIYFFNIF